MSSRGVSARRPALVVVVAALVLVPVLALRGQGTSDSPHGDLRIDCGDCHDSARWTPVGRPQAFRHQTTGFTLQGVHAKTSCRSCHGSLVFNRVGTTCADCHDDAHRGEFGAGCAACHTPTSWSSQRQVLEVHNRTRFPLFATHARLDCAACHRNQRPYQYASTPAECGGCHLSTFQQTTSPNHVASGFSRRCEDCHNVLASRWQEALFSHPVSFPLQEGHAGLPCARCHTGRQYGGLSSACLSCHQGDFAAAGNPSHAGFPATCQDCHTIAGWRPARFDHARTGFPLTGSHTRAQCAGCHAGGRYKGTPRECNSCHNADYLRTTNPNHQASRFPLQCQNCHSTTTWRPANFDHDKTRFPLTGAHTRADCARCHKGSSYAGTPRDCSSCHSADYAGTTNPNHVTGGFPTQCQTCHSTNAWRPAAVDHSRTRFPLTGAHARVDCARCHTGGRYTGTPAECNSCHNAAYAATTNPNHAAGGFPTQCQTCHSTSAWRPATVDHGRTRFPLTGAHTRVDCARCHTGGRYTGTPADCNSCHSANYAATTSPNHQAAGFPTQCQSCHTTSAWRPATWDHDGRYFPIYSGKHRGKWSTCADCHVSAGNYKAFECIRCHEHANRPEVDDKHKEVTGYAYQSAACYRCHSRGTAGFRSLRRRVR